MNCLTYAPQYKRLQLRVYTVTKNHPLNPHFKGLFRHSQLSTSRSSTGKDATVVRGTALNCRLSFAAAALCPEGKASRGRSVSQGTARLISRLEGAECTATKTLAASISAVSSFLSLSLSLFSFPLSTQASYLSSYCFLLP